MNFRALALLTLLSPIVLPYAASQTTAQTLAASALTAVPPLVPYSGQVAGRAGQATVTFLIYKDQQGGEPLFTESQIIAFDEAGRYKVQLGASNPNGLPSDLFFSGEARWLEIQIAGQPAEPRALLASVPYALKAADAATLGGLPASAFALAGRSAVSNVTPAAIIPDTTSTVTTTGGTANNVAKFSGANTIVNSILYDNGTEVGIGTTTPDGRDRAQLQQRRRGGLRRRIGFKRDRAKHERQRRRGRYLGRLRHFSLYLQSSRLHRYGGRPVCWPLL